MSFERSAALESQPTTLRRQDDAQYSDDPEYTTFTTELSDKLFSLTSNISQLNRQVGLIGTKRETDRVRERMQDLVDETNTAFKDIGEGLKRLSTWPDLNVSALAALDTNRRHQSCHLPSKPHHQLTLPASTGFSTLHAQQTQRRIQALPSRIPTNPEPHPRETARLRQRRTLRPRRIPRRFPNRRRRRQRHPTATATPTARTTAPRTTIRSRLPGVAHH